MLMAARTAAWASDGTGPYIGTFKEIVDILHSSSSVVDAKAKLIGKVVADTWVDLDVSGSGDATPSQDAAGHPIWNDPMVCTNVEMATGADGNQHLTAIMMRQYATAKKIQFDPRNHDEATEEFAQDGITYYGSTSGVPDISSVSDVTVLSLSPGDPVPYSSYTKVYRNSVNDPGKLILVCGYNRYQYSAWRQYLNAERTAGKGTWWVKQRVGQVAPNDGDYDVHPYKAGCSDALLASIKPIHRTLKANDKTDGGEVYTVCDSMWLPCVREMYGSTLPEEGSSQTEYWQQFIQDPSVGPKDKDPAVDNFRIFKATNDKNAGSGILMFLRSALVRRSDFACPITKNGNVGNVWGVGAYTAHVGVPVCAIY